MPVTPRSGAVVIRRAGQALGTDEGHRIATDLSIGIAVQQVTVLTGDSPLTAPLHDEDVLHVQWEPPERHQGHGPGRRVVSGVADRHLLVIDRADGPAADPA